MATDLRETSEVELVRRVLLCSATEALRILHSVGGLSTMARLGPAVLASRAGLSAMRARRLSSALELGRRACLQSTSRQQHLGTATNIAQWFIPVLEGLPHEEKWLVALDADGRILGRRRIAQGGRTGVMTDTPTLLRHALELGATYFTLVHNHPNGDPLPSPEDIDSTSKTFEAGEILGVHLADHLIIGAGGAFESMLALGFIPVDPPPNGKRKRRRRFEPPRRQERPQ